MIDFQIEKVKHARSVAVKGGSGTMVLTILCDVVLEILAHLKQNGMD